MMLVDHVCGLFDAVYYFLFRRDELLYSMCSIYYFEVINFELLFSKRVINFDIVLRLRTRLSRTQNTRCCFRHLLFYSRANEQQAASSYHLCYASCFAMILVKYRYMYMYTGTYSRHEYKPIELDAASCITHHKSQFTTKEQNTNIITSTRILRRSRFRVAPI